jgi:hypothetical protein
MTICEGMAVYRGERLSLVRITEHNMNTRFEQIELAGLVKCHAIRPACDVFDRRGAMVCFQDDTHRRKDSMRFNTLSVIARESGRPSNRGADGLIDVQANAESSAAVHPLALVFTGSPAFAGDDSLWLPRAHHVITSRM